MVNKILFVNKHIIISLFGIVLAVGQQEGCSPPAEPQNADITYGGYDDGILRVIKKYTNDDGDLCVESGSSNYPNNPSSFGRECFPPDSCWTANDNGTCIVVWETKFNRLHKGDRF